MDKIKTFVEDIIKAINKPILLCLILVLGLLVLEPSPFKFFCSGWCLGIFFADSMNTYYKNKYK